MDGLKLPLGYNKKLPVCLTMALCSDPLVVLCCFKEIYTRPLLKKNPPDLAENASGI